MTRASVTLVFDNKKRAPSDTDGQKDAFLSASASPVGYEHCDQITVTRQVVIGGLYSINSHSLWPSLKWNGLSPPFSLSLCIYLTGKNKYLINGHTAQAQQVQNLFHSVQLNVNNPHFLIMQGRITKVLNMKPPEILGMIEEAAGTRMFENKKLAALKTIEKKETKVQEINNVLAEEITPTLERLRAEQTHYVQFQANSTKVERLERFCVAHEYAQAEEAALQNVQEVTDMETSVKDMEAQETALVVSLKEFEATISDLQDKKA